MDVETPSGGRDKTKMDRGLCTGEEENVLLTAHLAPVVNSCAMKYASSDASMSKTVLVLLGHFMLQHKIL
jgi:hypothetical protein